MEGEAGEFQDWEVLHDSEQQVNSSDSDENLRELEGFEGESESIIKSDYFSVDCQKRYERTASKVDVSEEGSVESDNPSWVDPGSEIRYDRKIRDDLWSDTSSDRSVEHKFCESDAKIVLGFVENAKGHVGFEGIGEIHSQDEDSSKFWSDSGGDRLGTMKFGGVDKENEMEFGGLMETGDGVELQGEEKESIMEFGERNEDEDSCGEGEKGDVLEENETGNENTAIEEVKLRGSEEEKKRQIIWWKLPVEFLKFCIFRASPVWSVSVAAAVMGLVILGRRLLKMKRKSQSLHLKVALDDKKVSQFTARAARLNEAFSVVSRVPIIRPSLPAAGVTPWPVMSLR